MTQKVGRVSGLRRFRELRASGISARCGPIRITSVRSDVDLPCVAFAVGKRVGGAVVRNKLRRRIRSVFAEVVDKPGIYLVRADTSARELSYEELKRAVSRAVRSLEEIGR